MITLEKVLQRAQADARTSGCYLNPDQDFLNNLLLGLKQNEERYGYPSCPCRLATGDFELDRDIICPCDYRDPDVQEHGNCYCALYVRKDVSEGQASTRPIPERRPKEKQERAYTMATEKAPRTAQMTARTIPQTTRRIWYCKQCGYVCFREEPPYVCPICKAKKEMFAEIAIKLQSQSS